LRAQHSDYRKDIDGLRAIAVLSVVLFHIHGALMPGGFAGVDMFFVISGFVITRNIAPQMAAGTFSFAEFYRRRVNRIIPVLAVVVAATLLVGQSLLIPAHAEELAKSAIASLLFSANVFFTYFVETGYFASESSTKPLLHIWSLGVEEQFYFLWPLLALALLKLRRPIAVFALTAAAVIGLVAVSEWLTRSDPTFAYYMLPSRAFQLLTGAAVALMPTRWTSPGRLIALAVGVIGLALVGVSLVLIDETLPFPGIYALPATIGTGALIYSGFRSTPLSRVLSIPPMRWVGWISYSLYLWHWPVMAYLRYAGIEVTVLTGILAFVAMLLLSTLSYRFVEKPFRKPSPSIRFDFFSRFAVPSLAVFLVALGSFLGNTTLLPVIAPSYAAQIAALERDAMPSRLFGIVYETSLVTPAQLSRIVNGRAEPEILLWGDSNATHFVGFLHQVAHASKFSFRNIAHNGCPPIITGAGPQMAYPGFADRCAAFLPVVTDQIKKYKTIVMASAWSRHAQNHPDFYHHVRRTVERLRRIGKQVIILGQPADFRKFDAFCPKKELKIPWLNCKRASVARDTGKSSVDRANAVLQRVARRTGAEFVDIKQLMCRRGVCSPYMDGHLLFTDRTHLSMAGSERLGRAFVANGQTLLSIPGRQEQAATVK
jgi:peptidoglycan/LPS O-acetylase OafA/YrhL